MNYYSGVLFTTNWGIEYDNWVKVESPQDEGFTVRYHRETTKGTYIIDVRNPIFYLYMQITDPKGEVVYRGYMVTVPQYKKLKKTLGWK